jgi:membrane-associated PAP2 superfamily phosphatase
MTATPHGPAAAGSPASKSGWLAFQVAMLVAGAAASLYAFETTDLDRQVARLFFDAGQGLFPLRHTALFEFVLHTGAKQATYLAAAAALVVCWRGWRGRLAWLPRRNALLAAAGMILIPVSVSVLKLVTRRYCPWDITEFGGYAPYLRLLEPAPADIKAGQCFPAGHASTGYLWIVWGLALRPAGRRSARIGLMVGVFAGGLLGGARMAQGAHFLSHTLATLWWAWALSLVLAVALKADLRLGRREGGAADQPQFGAQGLQPSRCTASVR